MDSQQTALPPPSLHRCWRCQRSLSIAQPLPDEGKWIQCPGLPLIQQRAAPASERGAENTAASHDGDGSQVDRRQQSRRAIVLAPRKWGCDGQVAAACQLMKGVGSAVPPRTAGTDQEIASGPWAGWHNGCQ